MKKALLISQRRLRLAKALSYVGLVASISAAFSRSWLLFALCFLACVIGALWLERIYRCPGADAASLSTGTTHC